MTGDSGRGGLELGLEPSYLAHFKHAQTATETRHRDAAIIQTYAASLACPTDEIIHRNHGG